MSNRHAIQMIARILFAVLVALSILSCASRPVMEPHVAPAPGTASSGPHPDSSSTPALAPVNPPSPAGSGSSTAAPAMSVEKAKKEAEAAKAATAADSALGLKTGEPFVAEMASPSSPGAAAAAPAKAAPAQSGLKAGYSDDNEQFNYFVKFLAEYASVPHFNLAIGERIVLKVADPSGKSVANAVVKVSSEGRGLASGKTFADGSFALYPADYAAAAATSYRVEVSSPSGSAGIDVDRKGPRSVSVKLAEARRVPNPLPVDVLFILDTTGSMDDEIERLRATIEIINENIRALKPVPALRFGMVLYRDREDDYLTQVVPFTSNLDAFQKTLDEVYAGGGGDDPEDLQSALQDAVTKMKWNSDGIRLGFIITDAPPHLDYGQAYDYATASRDAKAKGIKLFSIGVGGLPLEGEYVLRQIAQYTQGKYIFLTYGEGGESAGGVEGSVSHHTGSNFTSDKLEAVVIRFVKEEISRQSDRSLEYDEAFYAAQRVADESREDTLAKLFSQALQNLSDYSTFRLDASTRCAVMPLAVAGEADKAMAMQAEYFGSQLSLAASKTKLFTIVERKDLQALLSELELQMSGLVDDEAASRLGKLMGADVLVSGTVYRKGDLYEVFLKLLRVESAEVLAAAKARIDAKLGL